MNQCIILIAFLFITNALITKHCQCNQIRNQFSCMLHQKCQWKSNSCQNASCKEFHHVSVCSQNKECFYNPLDDRCQELTDCSMLTATSNEECSYQSKYCGIYNPALKQCQILNFKPCNMHTTQWECLNVAQPCYWINQQCQEFDCALLKSQKECNGYHHYLCNWSIENQQCIHASCHQQPIFDCTFIVKKFNIGYLIQPCLVDYSEGQAKCREATLSELSPITCSLNTDNAAAWSDMRLDRGSCQECDVCIIKILVLTLLMMIF
ncbi:unnamed protein product [Paramecium octaurelia]|uniref:Uncharacterized protein n=1 Tax=Paramecium octaurelia TaxID=43137 RepID=A0A8S1S4U4_PAROT|nr:unnamed protein product [Paramecium octaurelia]